MADGIGTTKTRRHEEKQMQFENGCGIATRRVEMNRYLPMQRDSNRSIRLRFSSCLRVFVVKFGIHPAPQPLRLALPLTSVRFFLVFLSCHSFATLRVNRVGLVQPFATFCMKAWYSSSFMVKLCSARGNWPLCTSSWKSASALPMTSQQFA